MGARIGFGVLAVVSAPVAGAEELVRGVANVPYAVENAGIGMGEHLGRASLWVQQGEYGEATVDVLSSIVDFSGGFNAAASIAAPVAGIVESRVAAAAPTAIESSESVTISEGASAPRVAANRSQVSLPNPGETPMQYGTRVHQDFPRIVNETNPSATGTYNVRPGLTGPDLQNPSGMNANFAEMKSIWDKQSRIVMQAKDWGFDPQTGRYFFYDRETGRVFEGTIQTEKFPSGKFR